MKKAKKRQKTKAAAGGRIYSIIFLVLAILCLLMSVAGFASGMTVIGVVFLLFGLLCFYNHRIWKKAATNKVEKPVVAEKTTAQATTEAEAVAEARAAAIAELKESIETFNTVEIVFPDGHIERRHTFTTIDEDEGCLITDGGRTYHTDVGCFYNWSDEYQEKFTGWRLISIDDAECRGLRKCKFCAENDGD